MGEAIYKEIKDYLVTGFDKKEHEEVHTITDFFKIEIEKFELLIDFTENDISEKLIDLFVKNKKNVISGTTGHNPLFIRRMEELSKFNETVFIHKENFAKGFNNFKKMTNYLDKYESKEIIESHHISKIDSPSGSALVLADIIKLDYSKIKSFRTPDLRPLHMIMVTDKNEKIILIHEILDKSAFKEGFLEIFKEIVGDIDA